MAQLAPLVLLLLAADECGPSTTQSGKAVLAAAPIGFFIVLCLLWCLYKLCRSQTHQIHFPSIPWIISGTLLGALALWLGDFSEWFEVAAIAYNLSLITWSLVFWRLALHIAPKRAFTWTPLGVLWLTLMPAVIAACGSFNDSVNEALLWIWYYPGYMGYSTVLLLLFLFVEALLRWQRTPGLVEQVERNLDVETLLKACITKGSAGDPLHIDSQRWTLPQGKVLIAALGKTAKPMAKAAHLQLRRLGFHTQMGPITTSGGHPFPDEISMENAERLLAMAEELKEDDAILWLISGGASAMVETPATPAELKDLHLLWQAMDQAGWSIEKRNTLRGAISQIKHGRLAAAALPARSFSIVLSDVCPGGAEMVGSGPTLPMADQRNAALHSLTELPLDENVQKRISLAIQNAPPVGSDEKNQHHLLADPLWARRATAELLQERGFITQEFPTYLKEEAQVAAKLFATRARALKAGRAVVAAGEVSICLPPHAPPGGRCNHLALAIARHIQGEDNLAVLLLATDGEDGNSGSRGAIIDGSLWPKLQRSGTDPKADLQSFRSHQALQAMKVLLPEKVTHTNLCDLIIAIRFPHNSPPLALVVPPKTFFHCITGKAVIH